MGFENLRFKIFLAKKKSEKNFKSAILVFLGLEKLKHPDFTFRLTVTAENRCLSI